MSAAGAGGESAGLRGPGAPTPVTRAGAVIPNCNGVRWLDRCLDSLAAQSRPFDEIVVVDNGSTDGSLALLARREAVRVIEVGHNSGFAAAANRGIADSGCDAVALINSDVELQPDWLARMTGALARDGARASVACKMVDLTDPGLLYDAGDILRRDGVCEQRGRFERDVGRYDYAEEVFGACAGAALYRREAVLSSGGFDERFFAYLEDVDLALRLRLAGWTCAYEPVVARHAGGGSSAALRSPVAAWAQRNTLLLVARSFPWSWAGLVAYRQLGWFLHAARHGGLVAHLGGTRAALVLLPAMLRERRGLRRTARVPIEHVVPRRPIRGARRPTPAGTPARA